MSVCGMNNGTRYEWPEWEAPFPDVGEGFKGSNIPWRPCGTRKRGTEKLRCLLESSREPDQMSDSLWLENKCLKRVMRIQYKGRLRLTTRVPPWMPELFPKHTHISPLTFGVLTHGNCACHNGWREAPRNPILENQALHTNVMIDFFLFAFYLGIPEHKPALHSTPSREPPGPSCLWHAHLTAPACTCSTLYRRGEGDVKVCGCHLELQPHVGGKCAAAQSHRTSKGALLPQRPDFCACHY